jgi:hypothetical protein
MHVIAVRRDHIVFVSQRRDRSYGYRLLAYVEVAEAADLAQLIHFSGLLFVSAAEHHPPEHLDQLVAIESQKFIRLRYSRRHSAGPPFPPTA